MKRAARRDNDADATFSCGVVAVLGIVLLVLLGVLVVVELGGLAH